jgi:hypothetical protein|eukprot:COSAG02_NODE_23370_length_721_cov_0.573955_2_plen_71_part_00
MHQLTALGLLHLLAQLFQPHFHLRKLNILLLELLVEFLNFAVRCNELQCICRKAYREKRTDEVSQSDSTE